MNCQCKYNGLMRKLDYLRAIAKKSYSIPITYDMDESYQAVVHRTKLIAIRYLLIIIFPTIGRKDIEITVFKNTLDRKKRSHIIGHSLHSRKCFHFKIQILMLNGT